MNTQITYETAINYFGSPAKMAKRLGIKPQAIYQWNGVIPDLRQFQISAIIENDSAGPPEKCIESSGDLGIGIN